VNRFGNADVLFFFYLFVHAWCTTTALFGLFSLLVVRDIDFFLAALALEWCWKWSSTTPVLKLPGYLRRELGVA